MYEDPIAIVGAACRLPGAENTARFWDVLAAGRDTVTEIPDDRWAKDYFFDPNPAISGKSYTWAAGVLGDVDGFDAAFFGISPREAEQVDPQQRLLLELTWEAFEDAGIPAASVAGVEAGVYIGASSADYGDIRTGDPAGGNAYFMTGITASILANRISYVFDLKGPSFIVDTACSSSLVALDQACRAIADGRTPLAVAGGVNLLLAPYPFLGFCRASMLSPRGRCFAFDARADGYVRAEGAGILILKPLSRARADGDRIRGLILGTGVNSDGRTVGLSLPSRDAQARLLREVYDRAGIAPDSLAFLEAHGTGTAAGDPIETSAIGVALATRRTTPLPIGSVKTNVGHLEPASGMAGLFKAMLALEHRLVPPSLNFETPNPNIRFGDLNLEVVTRPLPLDQGPAQLVAGVNSFGFGGTNAHVILASAPPVDRAESLPESPMPPLLLSARCEQALRSLARAWADRLPDMSPAAAGAAIRAAARHRDHHPHRLVAAADRPLDLAEKLESFIADAATQQVASGVAVPSGTLGFVFSGNGVQRPGMAREALAESPVFRRAIADVDLLLAPRLGWSVLDRLEHDDDPASMARTDIAQPLLFAIQVGIVEALRACGIEAAVHAGHSVGEIAAAWAAGALTLEEACAVIVVRSHQQQRTAGAGGMAVLGIGLTEAEELLARLRHPVEIAAVNSSRSVTVAGPRDGLTCVAAEADRIGCRYTPLDLDYAFHSAALDVIADDLRDTLRDLSPRPCGRRFVSTVEGAAIPGIALDARYWWRNIRDPVRFADAVRAMIDDGVRIFVEIGPNPALLSYVRDGLKQADAPGRAIGTLTHKGSPVDPFPAIAAECHVAGAGIAASSQFDGPTDLSALPSYPWQRERHWFPITREGLDLEHPRRDHPLLGFRKDPASPAWVGEMSTARMPWLADHRLEDVPVLPGAALLEIAAAAVRADDDSAVEIEVSGLDILRAIVLSPGVTRVTRVAVDTERRLTIASHPRLTDEPETLHAIGRIAAGPGSAEAPTAPPPSSEGHTIESEALYEMAARLGLNYGPHFRVVDRVRVIDPRHAEILFRAMPAEPGFILDPRLMDGALQGCLALLAGQAGRAGESFIPARFGRVRLFAPFGRMPERALIRLDRIGTRSVAVSLDLFDGEGSCIALAEECWFQRVRLTRAETLADMVFRTELIPTPLPEESDSPQPAPSVDRSGENETSKDAEARLLFEAYLAARSYAALSSIDGGHGPIRLADLLDSGRVAPDAAGLFSWMLAAMERHGLAVPEAEGWRLADAAALPEAETIWRTLLAERPDLLPELALAAAAPLAEIVSGGRSSAGLPPALVDHLTTGSVTATRALDRLERAVAEIAASWPSDRPLRILEVCAGSGALTRRLVAAVRPAAGVVRLVATDSETQGLGRLDLALAAADGCRAIAWDPADASSSPPEGQFDLVVSLGAAARRRLDGSALGRLRERLAPNGAMLLAEPEPNDVWDVAFGQTADWWDRSLGLDYPISALRDAAEWERTLSDAGFAAVETQPIPGALWSELLIVARAPSMPQRDDLPALPPVIVIAPADDPLGREIALPAGEGPETVLIDPPVVSDGAALIAALAGSGSQPVRIVFPVSVDVSAGSTVLADRMADLLTVARLSADSGTQATIVVVSRSGEPASDSAEAAVRGLVRTLMNEIPTIDWRHLTLPGGWTAAYAAEQVVRELRLPDAEREIVWRPDGRYAPRLRRGLRNVAPAAAIRLEPDQPGLLDSLRWRPMQPPTPGPGRIAIETKAAGLNFRDVMWAMALLPEEALIDGFSGPTLGLECAGIVTEVGPEVEAFRVGDRVMALAPAALADRVVTAASAAVPIPESLDFAAAATVPVAALTVIYALDHLARLQADEWILIHGAAGGVGLLAVQVALARGARIVATAGSEAKRAFLRHVGVEHVVDSRDAGFADRIRTIVPDGVDVVLNSLNGDAMERSLGLLRPFGRFVELGKRDFMMDTRVGLRAMRRNVAYFAVDIDRLPLARPALAAELLGRVADMLRDGDLTPLPHRTFPFSAASEAFRLMQGSGHIGKIVLVPDGRPVEAEPVRDWQARANRTYVVTGGTAGFGLATARWLADRGAKSLALLSRRGAETPGATEAVAELMTRGVDVRVFACDVADAVQTATCLEAIRSTMAPIGGVAHAAMVVDDGLATDLTAQRIAAVLRPKLEGALHLDRLTRDDPVDFFLLFSSATTILGAPGQGSYVAANLALEALACRRHAMGLPALAVAFGPIADVGVLADQAAARDALVRRLATAPIRARDALDALPALLASGLPVVALAPVRWDSANQHLPIMRAPLFSELVSATDQPGGGALFRTRIEELPADEARELIASILVEEAARILAFAPERIDRHRPLSEFGMDSLMAVELRLALEAKLGIDVPLVSLSDNTSLTSLAKRIQQSLQRETGQETLDEVIARYETAPAGEPSRIDAE